MDAEVLWRLFPRTFPEFDAAFQDEARCRQVLIELRWGGVPTCDRCGCRETWALSSGRFECRSCGRQFSVTSGTILHGTRKPLRLWFRAIWEMMSRKNGISARDLQRIMGFGSYETAWTWLHKLRACMSRPGRPPLTGPLQLDDTYVGGLDNRPGRPDGNKAVVFVAVEPGGRARMEHSPNLKGSTIRDFANRNIAPGGHVTTDGYRSYSAKSLGPRRHHQHVQNKKRHISTDPLLHAHTVMSLFKRVWMGTYHGAPSRKHLQSYLDEFEFRHNRRRTAGTGRIVARVLQILASSRTRTYADIISVVPCRRFIAVEIA